MSINSERVQSVFLAVVSQSSAAERAAALDDVCAGDVELRRRVEALLLAHDESGSFLEPPEMTSAHQKSVEEPGDFALSDERPSIEHIGPYKLLQKLGEGGMGEVWMAEQEQPVKRRVAIKLIKPGMDSRHVIARFEQERQALALMDHPNIARVLDAGTIGEPGRLSAGSRPGIPAVAAADTRARPYFVMELVKGIPITRFCDQEHLSPRERLQLFIPVCHAVQHAHQKGIIHRDLKPSNVMIALYDGKPVPKVIDFGVAKATAQKLTERTMFTEAGQIVGTLEYMAPEQAELNNLDIDTRADVYSLGVLLYELLAGSPPFTREQLRGAGFSEMMRMIREVEPQRPSTRLSSSNALPSIAANRKLEPKRLTQAVHGDLDWITMKCLEKERGRRYETANALALDIERYLADEPVLAGAPGTLYRLHKFLRRNKRPVVAASLVLFALVAGMIGTSVGMVRARAAEHVAKDERDNAVAAHSAAVESEADTDAFSRFLVDDVLATARPEGWSGGLGVDITVRRALDEAAAKIGERFHGRPRAEAIARGDLGSTYRMLGEFVLAEAQLRRAVELRRQILGPNHPQTIACEEQLAASLRGLGKYEEGVALLRRALDYYRETAGPDHHDTLLAMRALAQQYSAMHRHTEAIALFEDVLKRSRETQGTENEFTLSTMNQLGAACLQADRPTDAVQLHQEAMRIRKAKWGEDHPSTLLAMHNLAVALIEAGHWSDAAGLFEKELKAAKVKFSPESRHTLDVMKSLGYAYQLSGRVTDAIAMTAESARLMKAKYGPDDIDTLASVHQYAVALCAARRHNEAIPLLDDTLRRKTAIHGASNLATLKTMDALAAAYSGNGQIKEAIGIFDDELKLCRQALGSDHSHTLTCMNDAALAYQDAGRLPEAIALYEENLKLKKGKIDPEHPNLAVAMHNLAWGYQAANRLAEAVPLYQEALRIRRLKLGPGNVETLTTLYQLAKVYSSQQDFVRAEAAYLELLAEQRKTGPNNPYITGTLGILGRLYLQQERFAEAEPMLRDCLTFTTKRNPGHWQVFRVQTLLAASLLGQKKYAEAEPHLLQVFDGLKAQEKSLAPEARSTRSEALQHLIRLYDDWDKKEEAAKWRKEQERRKQSK